MKDIKFIVDMKTAYMFDFLYFNSYAGSRGIINYAISLVGIVALIFGFGDSTYARIALIVLACLFTVIEPLMLLFKAFMQVKTSKSFSLPMTYTFNEDGILLEQGEVSQPVGWDMILLARESLCSIILFTGNNNATILPKKYIGDQLNDFRDLLRSVKPEESKKLRKNKA